MFSCSLLPSWKTIMHERSMFMRLTVKSKMILYLLSHQVCISRFDFAVCVQKDDFEVVLKILIERILCEKPSAKCPFSCIIDQNIVVIQTGYGLLQLK
ncbi:unnamed protein product [Trifolium pratense]|uniref:Uncharacterized protein n=1 Tax=Trifolium pratense TaxID=57577 RepID=A0ACB0L151_TRIPR|nr:unnamed protein product [Trifolium pratense]